MVVGLQVDHKLQLQLLKRNLDNVKGFISSAKSDSIRLKTEAKEFNNRLEIVLSAKDFYRKAQDIIYERTLGELEEVLDAALKYVFYDCAYSIKILLKDKRGTKQIEFAIIDGSHDPPMELSLKSGVGAGIRSLVSFVLLSFLILRSKSYPLLVLDETFSTIASQYLDRFFKFISDFSKAKGISVVLVSHIAGVADIADRVYSVSDGNVKLEKSKGTD
jgi:hypothetical protein